MNDWIKAWIVPGAVYQSVVVGGGYGTGREVVEFISSLGPWGGLAAVTLITVLMSVVLALSFELARLFQLREYRAFCQKLLGRFWVSYEVVFILGLVLVLAVAGSAAGEVLEDSFGIPSLVGISLMLLIVAVLNYCGREWVEKTLTVWGLLMSVVFIVFVVLTMVYKHEQVMQVFRTSDFDLLGNWWLKGTQFFLYTAFLIPAVIFAGDHIQTRRQALGAGVVAGILAVLPGLAFHLAFMAGYPAVLEQSLPTYWMLQQLGLPIMVLVYVVVLFGTIAQTGVGMLQGLNERLDSLWLERYGHALPAKVHSFTAVGAVVASLFLAKVGIVTLVAKGYGSLAWISLALFVLPLLTIGIWNIRRGNPAQ